MRSSASKTGATPRSHKKGQAKTEHKNKPAVQASAREQPAELPAQHLQLNTCKPLIAANLLRSLRLLANACVSFESHCVRGLQADPKRLAELMERSLMLVTALAPHMGYDRAAKIAHHAHNQRLTLRQAALAPGVSDEDFDRWVQPQQMAQRPPKLEQGMRFAACASHSKEHFMAHSSLVGVEHAALETPGRDTGALGPSDSSDSGSDMVGLDTLDDGDPGQPVDVAMNRDVPQPLHPGDTLTGGGSDSAGTGERRSAAGDGGREGGDIGVDRVFNPADEPDDDEDPDLAFIDQLDASTTPQPGRPNPEPDPPEKPGDGEDDPLDDEDREERKPGRD